MITIHSLLADARLLPVVTLRNLADAIPLAEALLAGGLSTIEITLRTEAALPAIAAIARAYPAVRVGAGTVIRAEQLTAVAQSGAHFAISPGWLSLLSQQASQLQFPYLPGIATISEAMQAMQAGHGVVKIFPASVLGGPQLISAIHTVLPDLQFCPTGGIQANNLQTYLSLPSVIAVGGAWLAPEALIQQKDWKGITNLVTEALRVIPQ